MKQKDALTLPSRRKLLQGSLLGSTGMFAPAATSMVRVSVSDWGLAGDGRTVDEGLQRALDEAPIGCDLLLPPGTYRTTRPLILRRHLNLVGEGATIVGHFGENRLGDLIAINIEDSGNRDSRNQYIAGLRLGFASGGRHALAIYNRAPNVANIGTLIERNIIGVLPSSSGSAIYLEGVGTHHLTIRNNQIENGIVLRTADGVTIAECLFFGVKLAIDLDLIAGAFQTRIIRNALVSRDGAVHIRNGSQIYIEGNTIEQFVGYGPNRSPQRAHLVIAPTSYPARHIHVVGNNFGGGDNVGPSIYVGGDCGGVFIDRNVFGVNADNVDIVLAAPSVVGTRIGPNNGIRGSAARRARAGAGNLLAVTNHGTGTFGLWIEGAVTPASGWRAAGCAVHKSLDGALRLRGQLHGSGMAGAKVARLADGYHPLADTPALGITLRGAVAPLRFGADGWVTLVAPATEAIDLAPISLMAAPPPYPPQGDL